VRVTTCAALCACLFSVPVSAEPFLTRDQNPLLAGFGLPIAMPARVTNDGAWSGAMTFNWGSSAVIQESDTEALVVDAETREARLTLQRALTDGFAVQLQIPYRYTGAGTLDGFIDSWHETFGLPEGERAELPKDRFQIGYARSGRALFDTTTAGEGLADIEASIGYALVANPQSALTAWLGIKLPTGDADKFTGSGATDVTLLIAGERRLADRWSAFGQAGATWLGDGDLLTQQQKSVVWSGLAGISWQAWRGLSLTLQFDAHTAAFDSGLKFLSDSVLLTVGGDYRFASGWQLDVGVSEDIAVERSPDVVFLIGIRRGW
jgi:hypothetical protein